MAWRDRRSLPVSSERCVAPTPRARHAPCNGPPHGSAHSGEQSRHLSRQSFNRLTNVSQSCDTYYVGRSRYSHLRDTEPALFGADSAAGDDTQGGTILAADLLWATSMVMSRGFGVSVPPQSDTAGGESCSGDIVVLRHMIPLMDAFNHDANAENSVRFEPESDDFVLTTLNDWEVGEEVFIHYGSFTPSEFLNGYGFVPREREGLEDLSGGFLKACWKAGLVRPEKSKSGQYEVDGLEALVKEQRARERQYLLLAKAGILAQLTHSTKILGLMVYVTGLTAWSRYSSTLEQDEEATLLDLPVAEGWEHMGSLLGLLVGEKRLLRECGERVAEALVRAQLRKIGIT